MARLYAAVMSTPMTGDSVRDRLDAAVLQAQREDDQAALEAAQEALGAIEDAESGANDTLAEADLLAIVLAQAVDREGRAAQDRADGRTAEADRLLTQAAYLREFTT